MASWRLQGQPCPFFIMMEETITEAQILHALTLSDITSKFCIIAMLIIVN
jgi:hypothetical protein